MCLKPRFAPFISVAFALWMAADAEAATLLVANKSDATLKFVRVPGFEIAATLPTGEGPHEVAVTPDGHQALVTNYGGRGAPGWTLTWVDVVAARVLGTIELPAGARPHGVEWLDQELAAVTAEGLRQLLIVDVPAGEVVQSLPVDQDIAHMVALTPDGSRAFVANIGSGTVTVLDLRGNQKITDLPSGAGTEGVAVVRDGREVWLSNRADGTLTVFDTDSLEELAHIKAPGFPIRIENDPYRGRVYVTTPEADALRVFDIEKRAQVASVKFEVGRDTEFATLFGDAMPDSSIPIGVQLSADGRWLAIAHSNARAVSFYQAKTLEREVLLEVGNEPDGMAWSALDVQER